MPDVQPVRRSEGPPALLEIVASLPLPPPRPTLLPTEIHAVSPYKPGAWFCEACDLIGDLSQAIRHAVRSQWDGRWLR